MEIYAEDENQRNEEYRIRKIIEDEEKQTIKVIKKRREQEVIKFNKLVALSDQYDKTLKIRQYIEPRA